MVYRITNMIEFYLRLDFPWHGTNQGVESFVLEVL